MADSTKLQKVQRQPLSLKQLRTSLHLLADGVRVPQTALISRQKFILFLRFCELEMLKSAKTSSKDNGNQITVNTGKKRRL